MGFVLSISKVVSIFVFGFWVLNIASHAQVLPPEEVQALRTISTKLQNKYWNISESSCTSGGFNGEFSSDFISNVKCNCSFKNNTVCHVTNIQLKGLNLTGVLPDEFTSLTYLQEIDLTRNYLNGTIPKCLAQLPLVTISLPGNRLSGLIPGEIGNIATLESLVLEDNELGGPLPQNLGNLGSLSRLLLASNNFTGRIPESFGNLKNLTDFRIDGSALTGKIPDFIGNWTKLVRLDLQGTSMEGPIPSNITLLKNLTELRISDLNGSSMSFPDLEDMKQMRILVLRNCLITGSIPNYIGNMTPLKILDLSFNKLTGQIPTSLESLADLDYMFLTNNSLTGAVPDWTSKNHNNFDLSYNNFTETSSLSSCQQSELNLVSSHSSMQSNSLAWCLKKDLPCSQKAQYHSLFINCGGSRMSFDGNDYEEDLTALGKSTFFAVSERWAYGSTGVFTGNEDSSYLASNTFNLPVTSPDYYKSARLAPLSLKYYGLCMRKGSYKVQLHFAEIMYSNDTTFSSLGKRIFDVFIQGNLVLKDFNIMEKAGGVGKGITVPFDNVHVNGTTLEVHLYWAGKGTTAIPNRGVYGPLISAITVTPNFKVDTGGLSAGAIVGIVTSSCVVVLLILALLRHKGYLGGEDLEDNGLKGLDLQTGSFTLRQIKAATNNFDDANKIGEGGFGSVYKGILSDGTIIAVKQLSSKSKQGNREFVNEIGMIAALQHPHLVKLYGCCIEGNQLLLVYEYMENNSLAHSLFDSGECPLKLDWSTRHKICVGIAKGLAYLHEESRLKIVHRDIKATNVLLDKDLNPKISDFGLAKLDEPDNTHISTRIAGTYGYMAPEYAMRGYLTDKADVYSFGIVALEIVSGRCNTTYRSKNDCFYLLDWALVLKEKGDLMDLVDPRLGPDYNKEEVMMMINVVNVALLCTNTSYTLRPSMSEVVSMLEGRARVQDYVLDSSVSTHEMNSTAMIKHYQQIEELNIHESHNQSISVKGPLTASSTSASDLYPVTLDSDYLNNRN